MYSKIRLIELFLTIGFCITLWIPYSLFTIAIRYISITLCILLILYLLNTKVQNIHFDSQFSKVLMILSPFIWLSINIILLIADK